MTSEPVRSHPSPLRQLLYVEWILLGMGLLLILTTFAMQISGAGPSRFPALEFATLIAVGLMGLRLPSRQRWHQLLYTGLEISLLVLMMVLTQNIPVMMRLLPLLGLVVVIRSCQLFSVGGRCAVVATVFSLHLFTALTYGELILNQDIFKPLRDSPEPWQVSAFKTNALLLFALILVFVSLLVNALVTVSRSQRQLAIAHDQLRSYAAKVESQATLQERNRIAREIHDALGHSLTAQTILLENALLFLPHQADRSRSYLTDAKDSAYQALQEVSRSVSALRTQPLQGKSIQTAIPALVNEVCKPAAINPKCTINLGISLSDEIALALFRIVQEALTNTVKHSCAAQVSVQLSSQRSRLHLQVFDNGKGFDPSKNTTGFGLQGMRERAMALGGTCRIWSQPGEGCRVSVILPLSVALGHLA
jgi:signal transduction histidine kinase